MQGLLYVGKVGAAQDHGLRAVALEEAEQVPQPAAIHQFLRRRSRLHPQYQTQIRRAEHQGSGGGVHHGPLHPGGSLAVGGQDSYPAVLAGNFAVDVHGGPDAEAPVPGQGAGVNGGAEGVAVDQDPVHAPVLDSVQNGPHGLLPGGLGAHLEGGLLLRGLGNGKALGLPSPALYQVHAHPGVHRGPGDDSDAHMRFLLPAFFTF